MWRTSLALLASTAVLPSVLATDILKTDGFTECGGDTSIKVNNVEISFDRSNNSITFDVAGSSSKEQQVTAELIVTAYGIQVYQNSFDPCSKDTKVDQLCPGMPVSIPFAIEN
jgi:ML-like domain